jgi:hypothetical protein
MPIYGLLFKTDELTNHSSMFLVWNGWMVVTWYGGITGELPPGSSLTKRKR